MSDEPENLTPVKPRRLDAKMDRVLEELQLVRHRLTSVETQAGQIAATEANHYAASAIRFDRVGSRLDRIERRLDLLPLA